MSPGAKMRATCIYGNIIKVYIHTSEGFMFDIYSFLIDLQDLDLQILKVNYEEFLNMKPCLVKV